MNKQIFFSRPMQAAAKIAVIYLVFSVAWILFSDKAVLLLIPRNPEALTIAQTGKGWLFTVISTLILFYLFKIKLVDYEKTAEALHAKEQYLTSIFRAVPTGIGVMSNRVFLAVNERICMMTGYRQEELIGQHARMLYPDEATYELVNKNIPPYAHAHETSMIETRWQRKDGVILDILLRSTHTDPHNHTAGITFTALDITAAKQAETALRKSEERYRELIELAVDGILLGSHDGTVIEANNQMCTMVGMGRENLLGKHISELPFTPESLQKTPLRFDLLQQNKIVVSERALIRPDGTEISFEMRTKMMPDGSYQSIYRDITARKQTELSLRESEEKFALAFAASPDAININRLKDGMYVEINTSFTELTGFTSEDVQDKTSHDLNIWYNQDDRNRLVTALKEKGSCTDLEALFRMKDGRLKTALMSARTITLNNEPHIISITRDITQRKQDAADLERLKVAIEHSGEIILVTDTDGNIQYANPAFEKITGFTLTEALRKNTCILKSDMHDQTFYNDMWHTISSGRTWTGRIVNRKKDGTLYTEEATISPVFDGKGKIVNYVAIKHDITAQLKLEAQYLQAQKMESIGRLTGGVAHDFNNILAIIIGYTELAMQQTEPSQKVQVYLKNIFDAANRSVDIVRQLLAFSRKQTITPKVLDLNNTVESMLNMLRRMIGEDIDLVWIPAPELAPVHIDPIQIDQILANLCVNARDAIDGHGKITIETDMAILDAEYCSHNVDCKPGTYAVLSVSDSGCGMQQEVIDKIFEPFFTTKGSSGTGLGLSTAYGIVKQNNGFINVYSKPGVGTTLKTYLPIQNEELTVQEEQEPEQPCRGRGETILLVEDDPNILTLGTTMLKALGYQVVKAGSPHEALEYAKQHAAGIDLLLTDVIMPDMNGKELSRQLLALNPDLKLVYMSGYSTNIIAQHGVLDPDVLYLQKPFSILQIAERVRHALDT